jgi:hypothetical protein
MRNYILAKRYAYFYSRFGKLSGMRPVKTVKTSASPVDEHVLWKTTQMC